MHNTPYLGFQDACLEHLAQSGSIACESELSPPDFSAEGFEVCTSLAPSRDESSPRSADRLLVS